MSLSKLFGEKPKEIVYFIVIELVIVFFGVLLAILALLAEPSTEAEITFSMKVVLAILDILGGISLGTILGFMQSLLIHNPAGFLLVSALISILFSGLNLLVIWALWNLSSRTFSWSLFLATINICLGFFGMPYGTLNLPIGIIGFAINFAILRAVMSLKTKELFDPQPVQYVHLTTILQLITGVVLVFSGFYFLFVNQSPHSLAQIGVFSSGIVTGFVSIWLAIGLWNLKDGRYIPSLSVLILNIAIAMLQWPYGALTVVLCLFALYYLLQSSVQEKFRIEKQLNSALIQVIEAIAGTSSILAGISGAIAGVRDQSNLPVIGGALAVLVGLALLWIAWETYKYGFKSPYLARNVIIATTVVNIIELGVNSFWEAPIGSSAKGFGIIVLVACTSLFIFSSWSNHGPLLEFSKEKTIWFSLFASIAMLLHIVCILSPEADVVSFSVDTAIYMGIFGILALSLNIEAGQTGLMNFGKVAFFAIGAYTTAILSRPQEPTIGLNPGLALPFFASMIISVLLAGFFGYLISIPTLKLRADYLAIVTFVFGEIIRFIIRDPKLRPTFGATLGLDVSRPFLSFFERFGVFNYRLIFYLPLVYLCLLVCYWYSQKVLNSPFGRVLRSIREDEIASESLGKNIYQFKTKSFIIGSCMAGLAGSLFAGYVTFIAESNFLPLVTFSIWIMLVVGGTGNNRGVIFGAILIQYFRRFTRFDLPSYALFGFSKENFRFIIIGLLLVVFILFRREGVFKEEQIQTVATDMGHALDAKKQKIG